MGMVVAGTDSHSDSAPIFFTKDGARVGSGNNGGEIFLIQSSGSIILTRCPKSVSAPPTMQI
jgi:hypothetical protein